jgi:hypothetical protein
MILSHMRMFTQHNAIQFLKSLNQKLRADVHELSPGAQLFVQVHFKLCTRRVHCVSWKNPKALALKMSMIEPRTH